MSKKTITLSIFFLITALIFLFTQYDFSPYRKDCAFCDQAVINRQKYYEDDLVLALYIYKPVYPGHSLIIPKRHVQYFHELTDEEILQMGRVIKKVHKATSAVFGTLPYALIQKNGKEAAQSVPHVHFHYIPRKEGDTSLLAFWYRMVITPFEKPLPPAELQENVQKMHKAMQNTSE